MAFRRSLLAASLLLAPTAAYAQGEEAAAQSAWDSIIWIDGPGTGTLGKEADVAIPATCRFTGAEGARKFMELTENPTSGNEHGLLLCAGDTEDNSWFVIFIWDGSGYVTDDDRDQIDANAIIARIREGTEASNEIRKERGWSTLTVDGWVVAPHYDTLTKNLTWSIQAHDSEGQGVVNHSVRLLGRGGVMKVDLVLDPAQLESTMPVFDAIVAGTTFIPGRTYAEWRDGDKVAGYGLTALVAGGAGVAAAKLGLFGKLWKVILGVLVAAKKLVIVVVLAAVALVKRLFGKKETASTAAT